MWDHVAIDPQSKLVVSLEAGKRTEEQTHALVRDARSRLAAGCLPAIFTDAYECYTQAILEAFGRRYPVARKGILLLCCAVLRVLCMLRSKSTTRVVE